MRNYKKLVVWQRSMALCKVVYKNTLDFPSDEKFGLTSQIRRSSISIPSNIAEGAGRSSDKEFARFVDISVGSMFELESQCILAQTFGYFGKGEFDNISNEIDELGKMLYGLLSKLRKGHRQ